MKSLSEYDEELLPILRDYASRGLISLRKHPDYDLYVASYTAATQYSKAWDDITLQTRCIILNDRGLVAKSFDKFFNVGEVPFESGLYFVSDKIDGSLILAVNWNGDLVVASKSSFTSDHALEAKKLLRGITTAEFGSTFELTHPNLRIVIDYGAEPQLWYLGSVNDPRQKYAEIHEPSWGPFQAPNMSAYYFITDDEVMRFTSQSEEVEGFVLTKSNHSVKYKAKTPWYLERHRVIFGLSPSRYLEVARSGKHEEFISSLPDEFQDDAKKHIAEYITKYYEIRKLVESLFQTLNSQTNTRKEFAALVMEQPANLRGMLFASYDNDGIVPDSHVWKSVQVE